MDENKQLEVHQVHEKNIRPFIDVIDKLRAVGIEKDLPIPQIAVMGDQSSGKSSVLEMISGVPFPRGSGLVTKCATELQMKRGSVFAADIRLSWNRAQPSEAGVVATVAEIGEKISKLTESLLMARGENATFEHEHRIVINLTSPTVPDLTIIDLPGIVRTSVDGQSGEVMKQVDALLDMYLTQDRTIILCVIPANVDIATVDILERARKVDAEGMRTIGVLTKPDLIGEGNEDEVISVLTNIRKPLHLGYLMVKNRSQSQINDNISLQQAFGKEMEFFRSHPHFGSLNETYFGTKRLMERLTGVLVTRIQDSLPDMLKDVDTLLKGTRAKLSELGRPPPTEKSHIEAEVTGKIQLIQTSLSQSADGVYSSPILVKMKDLRIMAQIRAKSGPQQNLQRAIADMVPSTETKQGEWGTTSLQAHISESRGRELPGFINPSIATTLIQSWLSSLQPMAMEYVNQVELIVGSVVEKLIDEHVPKYRSMANLFKMVTRTILEPLAKAARDGVKMKLCSENQPFTRNPHFMEEYNKILSERVFKLLEAEATSEQYIPLAEAKRLFQSLFLAGNQDNEIQEAENLQALLVAYRKTATERIIDDICIEVNHQIIHSLSENLVCALIENTRDPDTLRSFFTEDPLLQETRVNLGKKQKRLMEAYEIISAAR